ncbi:MAG: hypothetical protein R3C11_12410 [Planctomycetaceae bacterium]
MTSFPRIPRNELVDYLITLYEETGDALYAGEPVSQTEHALQAASLRNRQKSPLNWLQRHFSMMWGI